MIAFAQEYGPSALVGFVVGLLFYVFEVGGWRHEAHLRRLEAMTRQSLEHEKELVRLAGELVRAKCVATAPREAVEACNKEGGGMKIPEDEQLLADAWQKFTSELDAEVNTSLRHAQWGDLTLNERQMFVFGALFCAENAPLTTTVAGLREGDFCLVGVINGKRCETSVRTDMGVKGYYPADNTMIALRHWLQNALVSIERLLQGKEQG